MGEILADAVALCEGVARRRVHVRRRGIEAHVPEERVVERRRGLHDGHVAVGGGARIGGDRRVRDDAPGRAGEMMRRLRPERAAPHHGRVEARKPRRQVERRRRERAVDARLHLEGEAAAHLAIGRLDHRIAEEVMGMGALLRPRRKIERCRDHALASRKIAGDDPEQLTPARRGVAERIAHAEMDVVEHGYVK